MGGYAHARGLGHGPSGLLVPEKAGVLTPDIPQQGVHPLCAVGYRFSLQQVAFIYSKLYLQNALQSRGC